MKFLCGSHMFGAKGGASDTWESDSRAPRLGSNNRQLRGPREGSNDGDV